MFRMLISLLAAVQVFAGGFFLTLGNPSASSDPRARDAVVVVRPDGCHEPQKSVVNATAEGLVAGKRVSVPLHLVALAQPGTYAINREWPADGAWVLSIVAVNQGAQTSAVVRVGPNGFERKYAKFLMRKPMPAEIESALRGE